jgi:hypothetical protein
MLKLQSFLEMLSTVPLAFLFFFDEKDRKQNIIIRGKHVNPNPKRAWLDKHIAVQAKRFV